jgi:hypothetical protein
MASGHRARCLRRLAPAAAKLRRVIIAAKFKRACTDQPEPAEIHAIRRVWEDAEDLAA